MTTLNAPISKLYKRCQWNHHGECPGFFETYSVCSCACHAGVSDMRAAEVVAEAVAIVAPKVRKATPQVSNVETAKRLGTTPLGAGLSTKTDKYAKWANAIVNKNTRIRLAAEESERRRGVKPAVLGMAANRILAPRCQYCNKRQQVRWIDEHDFDSNVIVVPCGCTEKGAA